MDTKRQDFDEVANGLRSFIRSRPCLTDNEKLFIENRLLMLQMEYNLCAQNKTADQSKNRPDAERGSVFPN